MALPERTAGREVQLISPPAAQAAAQEPAVDGGANAVVLTFIVLFFFEGYMFFKGDGDRILYHPKNRLP